MKPTTIPLLRWIIRRDMHEVLAIENACFDPAWNEEHFLDHLRRRNCIGMVAESQGRIVGYMIYELHKEHINVINFAVEPARHREGIGTAMMMRLTDKLEQQRRSAVEIEVRETNLDAQLFLKSLGFRCVDIERQAYDETDEDGYWFQWMSHQQETASPPR